MSNELRLSNLPHTWIFDYDGTLVKHNGYKLDGYDTLLNGVTDIFKKIPNKDYIIILTGREEKYKESIKEFMHRNGLRCDDIICGLPVGERILINDDKPSGLQTGHVIRKKRDVELEILFTISEDI